MKNRFLMLAATALLGGVTFSIEPALAAPLGPAQLGIIDSRVELVRMHRGYHGRHHMMRRRSSRSMRMQSDPNTRNPSQPGYAQQKGQTSGGPRY